MSSAETFTQNVQHQTVKDLLEFYDNFGKDLQYPIIASYKI